MMNFEKYKLKSSISCPSTYSLPVNFCNLRLKKKYFEDTKKKLFAKVSEDLEQKSDDVSHENRDPNTFSARYTKICQSLHTQPLNMVRVLQSNVSLDLICDRIKFVNMVAILKTIREDRSLHYIALTSKVRGFVVQEHVNTEKKAREAEKVLFTRFMVNMIGECIGECLKYSTNLTALRLQGIPIKGRSIELLCEGLSRTQTLQHLSLNQSNIGDEGCFQLSRALKNVPTLLTMDLSFGNITAEGARHISDLIKFQELARFDQNWKQSLRFRQVNNDEMKGLRRVTLNDNPEIGDEGLKFIMDVLMDDFWIRAIDVQNCGISDCGGLTALQMIQTNSEIGVVDLRRNPLLNYTVVAKIVNALRENMTEEKAEYGWLCISKKRTISSNTCDATSTSYKNSTAWNSGPGKGNNLSEKKSLKSIEEAKRLSIRKVIEWKQRKKHEKGSSCGSGESKVENEGNRSESSTQDIQSSNSLVGLSSHDFSGPSDKSCLGSMQKPETEPQEEEDIELIFNKCVMFSQSDGESDVFM